MSETAIAFLLFYVSGLTLAVFVRPMFGLYTYVGVFYLDPLSRWWGQGLPDLRWSFIAAIVTLLGLYLHRQSASPREPWYRSSIIAVLILYTSWMWLQTFWVESPDHMGGTILFTKYVFLAYLIYSIIDNESDLKGFCMAHVAGCAYFGALIYLAPDTGRLESVGGAGIANANTLAMHLATGLMFASFLMLRTSGVIRWLTLLAIPFILNGIIQTETRGALVGLFLGGIATVYLKPKRLRRIYYILVVVGAVGFTALANDAFVSRMETLVATVDESQVWDNSARSRVEIVKSQLDMFSDHPFGVGHQGTAFLSRQYIDERWLASNSGDRASHNTVMSVLVDQGILGVILLVILFVAIVKILRRLKAMDATGLSDSYALYRSMLGGAIVTIFGSGLFAQNLKAEVQIWCLVLLAVLWGLARQDHAQSIVSGKKDSIIPTARQTFSESAQ